jgi:hypothetical protein
MRVFPVGVEHPLDVTVQRPQHLDPRNHEFSRKCVTIIATRISKIVKHRDDLVSALRYGIMMRRGGKPLSECQGVGYGNMPYANQRPERSGQPRNLRARD